MTPTVAFPFPWRASSPVRAYSARSRVHEYGGAAWLALTAVDLIADGSDNPHDPEHRPVVVFVNFVDQRVYCFIEGEEPRPLTPVGPVVPSAHGPSLRWADPTPVTLADGTELSPALGIGAFCDKTLVAAGQCTKVDEAASPAAAGLLGCGVMAGIGAAINTGGVGRGDTVAVFGCGGVGNAAIAGSRLAGAATIIGVDIDDQKLAWAKDFGATHVVNSAKEDVVERIKELTGGFGADVCIEAVGNPAVYAQAFEARDLAGTVVLVGVPTPDMRIELPFQEVFGRGGALKSSWYGDCLPSRDFPMLIDLYLQGRLDLDSFVSETIGIDGVEEAFHKMERGEVLRSVVVI